VRGFDVSSWLRTLRTGYIAGVWASLVVVGFVVGIIAERIGWVFLADVLSNFVPDILVAGLAFIVAEAVFGFRERQQRRTEQQTQVIEAQRKAYLVIAREMFVNEDVLEKTVATLQGGQMPPSNTKIEKENWNLLVQSPLVVHLPVQHVWAVHESYYMSNQLLDGLIDTMQRTPPASYKGLAQEYLPKLEEILARTREAIEMLESAFISG
jgi:hypothetical protein